MIKINFILQITDIKKKNSNFKVKTIINLTIYFKSHFYYFFNIKKIFYMLKTVINKPIIYNKNKFI